jgi:hypothetical protein
LVGSSSGSRCFALFLVKGGRRHNGGINDGALTHVQPSSVKLALISSKIREVSACSSSRWRKPLSAGQLLLVQMLSLGKENCFIGRLCQTVSGRSDSTPPAKIGQLRRDLCSISLRARWTPTVTEFGVRSSEFGVRSSEFGVQWKICSPDRYDPASALPEPS